MWRRIAPWLIPTFFCFFPRLSRLQAGFGLGETRRWLRRRPATAPALTWLGRRWTIRGASSSESFQRAAFFDNKSEPMAVMGPSACALKNREVRAQELKKCQASLERRLFFHAERGRPRRRPPAQASAPTPSIALEAKTLHVLPCRIFVAGDALRQRSERQSAQTQAGDTSQS